MINWNTRMLAARDFARNAHDAIGQKRKYSGENYWVHVERVADLVSSVTNDEDMIIAAHFHDILEDVTPSLPDIYNIFVIAKEFGEVVAGYVTDLTDVFTREAYPNLNRKARKTLEAKRLGTIHPNSQTIKLADLLDNTADILAHDKGFGIQYLKEKEVVLPYLKEGNQTLFLRAVSQLNENKRILNIQ